MDSSTNKKEECPSQASSSDLRSEICSPTPPPPPFVSEDYEDSSQVDTTEGKESTQEIFITKSLPISTMPLVQVEESSMKDSCKDFLLGKETSDLEDAKHFSFLKNRGAPTSHATVQEAVTLQNRLRASHSSLFSEEELAGQTELLDVPSKKNRRRRRASMEDEKRNNRNSAGSKSVVIPYDESDNESDTFVPSPEYGEGQNLDYGELENLTGNPALIHREHAHSFSKKFKKYNPNMKYSFFSQKTDLMQSDSLFKLAAGKQELVSLLRDNIFWIDVSCPTETDMKIISKIFKVHPLTIEDIQTSDTREKCEVFESYIFLCLRVCDESLLTESVNIYVAVFADYIFSIHYQPLPHIKNILKRLEHLNSYITITSDWMMYSILDEITDQFIPVISTMEVEIDTIDDLVLVLSESEQSDLLKRIGGARKRVTFLQRLLRPKYDLLKVLTKRCSDRILPQVLLYLRDIQDHIIEMTLSLDHYSETLNRSHGNYLAQINIEITQASNRMNIVMKKFTAAASILLPLQLISGLWGMNVDVPGQPGTAFADYGWFLGICVGMIFIMVVLLYIGRKNKWL